jgi:hypothetical protein
VITDIVLALAIFFIGLPLAGWLLFMALRLWWLIPIAALFIIIAVQGPPPAFTGDAAVTKGSSFSAYDEPVTKPKIRWLGAEPAPVGAFR